MLASSCKVTVIMQTETRVDGTCYTLHNRAATDIVRLGQAYPVVGARRESSLVRSNSKDPSGH